MGRTPRANLPGVPFHVTSRVQGREPLFLGLEERVGEIVQQSVLSARMRLLAYAVMPNHLHLVLVQGPQPLAHCMQPLLRRLALLVLKTHARDGHVFERRYRDRACLDAFYLRNVIAYVHLNPVRAGLCTHPAKYAWTSHRDYCCNSVDGPIGAMLESGLRLFAHRPAEKRNSWIRAYREFLRWRVAYDRALEADPSCTPDTLPRRPWNADGDAHWNRTFAIASDAAQHTLSCSPDGSLRPDLTVIANAFLRSVEPQMTLAFLRSGDRTWPLVRARRTFIERALIAGYAPHQIARFLNVSASIVSRVVTERRRLAS